MQMNLEIFFSLTYVGDFLKWVWQIVVEITRMDYSSIKSV